LRFPVIPANPGSGPGQAPESSISKDMNTLDSGFHRSDDFLETINIDDSRLSFFAYVKKSF
jgi:hypothetical protein